MNFFRTLDRAWLTIGPFWAAGYCAVKGIENIQSCLVSESSVTLLKVGAVQFPVAAVVALTAIKVFDSLGYHQTENRLLKIGLITSISSAVLTPLIALRLGLTASSNIAFLVPFITTQFGVAAICMGFGIDNIFNGANHRPPRFYF